MSKMEEKSLLKCPQVIGDTELRLLIQSKAANSVIGNEGQKFCCFHIIKNPPSITIPDCPGPERVLTIRGSLYGIFKVLREVIERLDMVMDNNGKTDKTDTRMLVSQSQVGSIIGLGGLKIKELRQEFGVNIKVYGNVCPQSTDQVVQITGNRDHSCKTIERLLKQIKVIPVMDMNTLYNPYYFDENLAYLYGGWGVAPKRRFGPPLGLGPPPDMRPQSPIWNNSQGAFSSMHDSWGQASKGIVGTIIEGVQSPHMETQGSMKHCSIGSYMNLDSPDDGDLHISSTKEIIFKDSSCAFISEDGNKTPSESGASLFNEDNPPGSFGMQEEKSPNCPLPICDIELRILTQRKATGFMIGKGGKNITCLRNMYPAIIKVIGNSTGPESVLSIKGTEDVVVKVLGVVIKSLDKAMNKDCETDTRMLVHRSLAGCVFWKIGKDGLKVKKLMEECGGHIKVYEKSCPQSTDRVIQITGDRERSCNTIARILDIIKDIPIRGINNPYNPHNFEKFFSNKYGGWGEVHQGGFEASMEWDLPQNMVPQSSIEPGPLGSFINGNSPNGKDLPATSTEVTTIPNYLDGSIIGKGGTNILKIHSDSGSSISIVDTPPGDFGIQEEMSLNSPRPVDDIELRLLTQSKATESVIGQEGQNITRLRKAYPANITVYGSTGPERVLYIKGTENFVLKVLGVVMESLDKAMNKDFETDTRMLVHYSRAGCVIGKDGQQIKKFMEECHGHIIVYKNCCPQSTDQVIQITGERKRSCNTIARILELIMETPILNVNHPYNPHNFKEFSSNKYGGWGEVHKGGFEASMEWDLPQDMVPQSSMEAGPVAPFMNETSPYDEDLPASSTKVTTIPKNLVGLIIGQGGANIWKIRSESGATISIEDPCPESSEQSITIEGSDLQIKHAQSLLKQYAGIQNHKKHQERHVKKVVYATGIPKSGLKEVSDANTPGAMIDPHSGQIVVPHLMDYVTNAPSCSGDTNTNPDNNCTEAASLGTSSKEMSRLNDDLDMNIQEQKELVRFNSALLTQATSFHGHQLLQHLINQHGKLIQDLDLNKVDYRTVYQSRIPSLRKQDASQRNELLLLIKIKAGLIYETMYEIFASPQPPSPLHYEGYYRVMPPLEYYLDVKADIRKKHFLKSIKYGDLLYCKFLTQRSGKGSVKVTATGGGKHRSLLDMNIIAQIKNTDIKSNEKDSNIFGFWPSDTDLLVEVLQVCDIEETRSHFSLEVGTKGVTLHPYLKNKVTLGKISESEIPPILSKMIKKKVNSFDECIRKSANFCNPQSIKYMSKTFSISLIGEYSSIMDSLKSKFPQSESYSSIRAQQYTQWAYNHVSEGVACYKEGRISEALNEFRCALEYDNENTEALVARGALFANQGDYVNAVYDFEYALKIDPTHSNAKSYICETAFHLGKRHEDDKRYDKACEIYNRCLQIDSSFSSAQKALKEVVAKMLKYDTSESRSRSFYKSESSRRSKFSEHSQSRSFSRSPSSGREMDVSSSREGSPSHRRQKSGRYYRSRSRSVSRSRELRNRSRSRSPSVSSEQSSTNESTRSKSLSPLSQKIAQQEGRWKPPKHIDPNATYFDAMQDYLSQQSTSKETVKVKSSPKSRQSSRGSSPKCSAANSPSAESLYGLGDLPFLLSGSSSRPSKEPSQPPLPPTEKVPSPPPEPHPESPISKEKDSEKSTSLNNDSISGYSKGAWQGQSSMWGGPWSSGVSGTPQGPWNGPPQGSWNGPPQGPWNGPPPGPWNVPPPGPWNGAPPQGPWNGPPPQGPWSGPSPQGPWNGPPQGPWNAASQGSWNASTGSWNAPTDNWNNSHGNWNWNGYLHWNTSKRSWEVTGTSSNKQLVAQRFGMPTNNNRAISKKDVTKKDYQDELFDTKVELFIKKIQVKPVTASATAIALKIDKKATDKRKRNKDTVQRKSSRSRSNSRCQSRSNKRTRSRDPDDIQSNSREIENIKRKKHDRSGITSNESKSSNINKKERDGKYTGSTLGEALASLRKEVVEYKDTTDKNTKETNESSSEILNQNRSLRRKTPSISENLSPRCNSRNSIKSGTPSRRHSRSLSKSRLSSRKSYSRSRSRSRTLHRRHYSRSLSKSRSPPRKGGSSKMRTSQRRLKRYYSRSRSKSRMSPRNRYSRSRSNSRTSRRRGSRSPSTSRKSPTRSYYYRQYSRNRAKSRTPSKRRDSRSRSKSRSPLGKFKKDSCSKNFKKDEKKKKNKSKKKSKNKDEDKKSASYLIKSPNELVISSSEPIHGETSEAEENTIKEGPSIKSKPSNLIEGSNLNTGNIELIDISNIIIKSELPDLMEGSNNDIENTDLMDSGHIKKESNDIKTENIDMIDSNIKTKLVKESNSSKFKSNVTKPSKLVNIIDINNIKTEPIEDLNVEKSVNIETKPTEQRLNQCDIKKEPGEQELFTNVTSEDIKKEMESLIIPLSISKTVSTKHSVSHNVSVVQSNELDLLKTIKEENNKNSAPPQLCKSDIEKIDKEILSETSPIKDEGRYVDQLRVIKDKVSEKSTIKDEGKDVDQTQVIRDKVNETSTMKNEDREVDHIQGIGDKTISKSENSNVHNVTNYDIMVNSAVSKKNLSKNKPADDLMDMAEGTSNQSEKGKNKIERFVTNINAEKAEEKSVQDETDNHQIVKDDKIHNQNSDEDEIEIILEIPKTIAEKGIKKVFKTLVIGDSRVKNWDKNPSWPGIPVVHADGKGLKDVSTLVTKAVKTYKPDIIILALGHSDVTNFQKDICGYASCSKQMDYMRWTSTNAEEVASRMKAVIEYLYTKFPTVYKFVWTTLYPVSFKIYNRLRAFSKHQHPLEMSQWKEPYERNKDIWEANMVDIEEGEIMDPKPDSNDSNVQNSRDYNRFVLELRKLQIVTGPVVDFCLPYVEDEGCQMIDDLNEGILPNTKLLFDGLHPSKDAIENFIEIINKFLEEAKSTYDLKDIYNDL